MFNRLKSKCYAIYAIIVSEMFIVNTGKHFAGYSLTATDISILGNYHRHNIPVHYSAYVYGEEEEWSMQVN